LEQSSVGSAVVMELVDGEDLAVRIARAPFPIKDAPPIARQLAEAIEAAHESGIIRRDLKPANIKVRADGIVKVLDFGLAKLGARTGGGHGPGHVLCVADIGLADAVRSGSDAHRRAGNISAPRDRT